VLGPREVHVWSAPLDRERSVIETLERRLTSDERERAERFYFEQDREHFIVARGLLRGLLAAYLGLDPIGLRFVYGPQGKPALASPSRSCLRFNVSHSCGIALFAVAEDRAVGVDLEYYRPWLATDEVAERFFSAAEVDSLRGLAGPARQQAFFHCWTRKEAYLKARGDGLAFGLDRFDVSLVPGEPPRLVSVDGHPGEVARWSLFDLRPERRFVGALATEGPVARVKCWSVPTL
jgi:4'-phosphopantetheinyl transferase